MHIADVLRSHKPALSFEFFPPKTQEGANALFETISELKKLEPAYVSVTYGAGGSTRELTHDLVVRLSRELGLTIVSHLTCVGSSKEEIRRTLERYSENGIENILALRGDIPKHMDVRGSGISTGWQAHPDGFHYAAQLVAFIKENFPKMGIGVAGFPEGHPETPNRLKEIEYLKAKVDAGADYICTQLFFDNNDFYDFCERCSLAGINVPIIAGIMPITSRKGMQRMAELSLGSRFPAKLLRALARAEDDAHAESVGIHWATEQVLDLIDNGVAGVHFYTLNKSKATLKIYQALGVTKSNAIKY
ncbi:MAG: 5,10-methylenetetrahydrofolate reductase [Turneriella sp.]|nr:5,10-methylenetetrahydrofolate reductase [Turneriella sp.]